MTTHVLACTTTDSERSARELATSAIEARLAACAQVEGPITSVYRWQGEVETATEWRVTYKTTAARYPDLQAHLLARHPYDTPELITTPVTGGSDAYLRWLEEQVSGS